MNLRQIELVRHPAPKTPPGWSEVSGPQVDVLLRYDATDEEIARLYGHLLPGGKTPPRAFWEALNWGYVDQAFTAEPLTLEEASDIRLAEAKASVLGRIEALFAACIKILNDRRQA